LIHDESVNGLNASSELSVKNKISSHNDAKKEVVCWVDTSEECRTVVTPVPYQKSQNFNWTK